MSKTATKREVAERYGVTVRTVTNWMYKEKRISFLKIGRMVRFDLSIVDQELQESGLIMN